MVQNLNILFCTVIFFISVFWGHSSFSADGLITEDDLDQAITSMGERSSKKEKQIRKTICTKT